MKRTLLDINKKIKQGKAQVLTKEELLSLVKEKGYQKAYKEVDVVTTATFGPMCSSGIYFNMGNTSPKIKFGGGKVTLDKVPCYPGFAAGDLFLGATALKEDDPANSIYPGSFSYGGGHLIRKLVSKEDVLLEAKTYGTDCYPRKELKVKLNINDLNEAVLFNIRNSYQNYNAAVNTSDKPIYTYMGMLRPNLGNVNFSSAGFYSPLLCDPNYRVIGVGTKIFLGGTTGFVSWWGTQHNPTVKRGKNKVPQSPAGTMAVIGDLKKMSRDFLIGVSITGYGVSLSVGIGVPIPILDKEIFEAVCVQDKDIVTQIVDYSHDYPKGIKKSLGKVNYKQLRSGSIEINKKKVPTGCLSSLKKARQIAGLLKTQIEKGEFLLTEKVASFPDSDSNYKFKSLDKKVK